MTDWNSVALLAIVVVASFSLAFCVLLGSITAHLWSLQHSMKRIRWHLDRWEDEERRKKP